MAMKLNLKEKKVLTSLEPVLLAIGEVKSQLAFLEAQKGALELQLQQIDPRKLIGGKTWHNGVELYTFRRDTTSYKNCALSLAALQGWSKIPEDIKIQNSKVNQCLKTRLGGI
tara:strand:+ start:1957 stop:2295 length:339 start_codon:yes stop_codon:yes gene_type:complete